MRISLVVVSPALLAPAMAIVAVSAAGRECSLGCCRGCRSHLHLGQDLVTASTTAVVASGAGGVAALPIFVATVAGLIVLVGTVVAILIAIDLTARFVVELGPLALVILALLTLVVGVAVAVAVAVATLPVSVSAGVAWHDEREGQDESDGEGRNPGLLPETAQPLQICPLWPMVNGDSGLGIQRLTLRKSER